ncbi:IS3 family transposase [Hymenobacter lapidiphilus]|uniref:IS3 family transposase n=1 Tax=Hymenobacter lapidiphilus TaxID=2608003 RepID=A0A7Y7PR37_9BACT|nr:IS3 family transposase [Hymenobacter lapidiphilus]NVO32317.1 IS3 family transposase [Hymenobacter lapidiphilus]
MSALQFIDQQRVHYSVGQLCRLLSVVPSTYYAWRHRLVSGAVRPQAPAWETEMLAVFDHHKRRYGTRRLQVELRDKGHRVGRQALRTSLRRHGRRALQPKAFAPRTTDSTHGRRCAPNLLLDQPRPTQANRVWVSDITYLPLANGRWAYLCAFQDVASKQVVGWQVRADMPEALVTSALQRALLAQRPAPGLIVHSDRGGQYVSNAYKALLREAQAQLSHSRRGECYDNAQAESLWSRLKTEELEAREWPVFADLADAQASVTDYFDYYNHERRHSSIGYSKPYLFHQQQLNSIA